MCLFRSSILAMIKEILLHLLPLPPTLTVPAKAFAEGARAASEAGNVPIRGRCLLIQGQNE